MPHFLANKAGMVPTEEMQEDDRLEAEVIWQELIDFTKNSVAKLNDLKVHKQWGNRPLEWFGYIDVLISSTDWSNFMALRDEPTAQQEIQGVAKVMKQLMDLSEPEKLTHNEWHLPYVTNEDRERYDLDTLKKLSTARCARLSYRPFDGNDSLEREIERYERLMVSRPVHASPAEHVATPDIMLGDGWGTPTLHGNFYGWRQYRKMIPHNTIEEEGR